MKKILFGLTTLGILVFVGLIGANQASAKICNAGHCYRIVSTYECTPLHHFGTNGVWCYDHWTRTSIRIY